MQKKYLALQSSGFIGLKENLENQEKIWKIEKPGKFKHSGENSWKMFELSFNLLQHGVVHNLVILFDIL